MTAYRTPADCICPHGERSLGRLYNVSMGRGIVRLSLTKGCPEHDACHNWTKERRADYASTRPWTDAKGPYCPIHASRNCP